MVYFLPSKLRVIISEIEVLDTEVMFWIEMTSYVNVSSYISYVIFERLAENFHDNVTSSSRHETFKVLILILLISTDGVSSRGRSSSGPAIPRTFCLPTSLTKCTTRLETTLSGHHVISGQCWRQFYWISFFPSNLSRRCIYIFHKIYGNPSFK